MKLEIETDHLPNASHEDLRKLGWLFRELWQFTDLIRVCNTSKLEPSELNAVQEKLEQVNQLIKGVIGT